MANPYNSDVSQQNKSGGGGVTTQRGSSTSGGLTMKAGPFGAGPGPHKAAIGTKGFKSVKQYTKTAGIPNG